MNKLTRLLAGCALIACFGAAHAQYIWIDDKGVKQLSDQPPPASVPAKNILKSPRKVSLAEQLATPAPAPAAPAKAPPTLVDRNAEYTKRRADEAAKDKKAGEEARVKAEQAAACEALREHKRLLESGKRMSSIDKSGETVFVSDDERAQQMAQVTERLNRCN